MVRYASSTSNWRLALSLIDEMNQACFVVFTLDLGVEHRKPVFLSVVSYVFLTFPCWAVPGSSGSGQRGVQYSFGSLCECRTARPGANHSAKRHLNS